MRVAFDIGGLISRYPSLMIEMMEALHRGGVDVYVLTDMKNEDAVNVCIRNGIDFLPAANILSADWSRYGYLCKSEVCEHYGIDVLFDDRPDYTASGNFIGFNLSPRPHVPYYADSWSNVGVPTVCVSTEEYDEFKLWKSKR